MLEKILFYISTLEIIHQGCTTEAIDFNKLLPVIKKNNGIVIGVSKDSLESHMKFKSKNKLKFDLLSDENIKVLKSIRLGD
jgi:peroxiredoxin Q/BCP